MSENKGNSLEDAALVALVNKGDAAAFGVLYERYLDRIYRYLRLRLGNDRDAEDLAEMVFVRAFESIGRYEDRGWPFSAYLYQIGRNVLADHYRKLKHTSPLDQMEPVESSGLSVDELVIYRERLDLVKEALQTLPEDYQEVIRLRVILKLPTESTARWLNRSQGAVRVLLYRALRRLRDAVAEMSDENDA